MDNLLLQGIWDRVLEARKRHFLYAMTVKRRPAEWSPLGLLGEVEKAAALLQQGKGLDE